MLRSKALLVFGWTVILIGGATATEQSNAAGRAALPDPVPAVPMIAPADDLTVLPLLARHDAPLFGSFIGPTAPAPALPADSACGPDMVEVEGEYCPYVEQRCLKWSDPTTKLQCEEFEKLPSAGKCFMPAQHKHFCIDRYEWPNKAGEIPSGIASFNQARASCETAGQRLCSVTQATASCEGPGQP